MINIPEKLDAITEGKIEKRSSRFNYASDAGWVDDCLLHLVLKRLHPEKELLHGVDLQRIFEEGKRQEKLLRQELRDSGIEILKEKKKLSWPDYKLKLDLDDFILANGDKYPIEYKSCNPNTFRTVARMTDPMEMLESRFVWMRHWPAQLLLYEACTKLDPGIFLFKHKDDGRKHQLNCPLNINYTERILAGLADVNEMVEKKKLPRPEWTDACKNCGFLETYCFPDQPITQDRVPFVTDEEAEVMLTRRQEIEDMEDGKILRLSKEHAKLDKAIKERYRGESVVIGNWKITSNPYDTTIYDVPQKVKDEYKDKAKRFRMSIRNIVQPI